MNNIEILEELIQRCKECKFACCEQCEINWKEVQAIENLIQENKELKEKFDVMQRKIYRLEEDNIELLKPKGKDQLNYKYIECPKVEAEWYKSESYIEENYIPKSKIKEKIEELKTIKEEHSKSFNWGEWEDGDVYDEIIAWFQELLEEGE